MRDFAFCPLRDENGKPMYKTTMKMNLAWIMDRTVFALSFWSNNLAQAVTGTVCFGSQPDWITGNEMKARLDDVTARLTKLEQR